MSVVESAQGGKKPASSSDWFGDDANYSLIRVWYCALAFIVIHFYLETAKIYCSLHLSKNDRTKMVLMYFWQTDDGGAEEVTDESFIEDAADIDARKMAMKEAEGFNPFCCE